MTHYRATFTDGTVIERRDPRRFTHAWLARSPNWGLKKVTGFSSGRELADRKGQNAVGEGAGSSEIVAVEIIT